MLLLYRTPYRISALLYIQTPIQSRQVITVHHVAKSVLQSVLEGGGHWFDSQIEVPLDETGIGDAIKMCNIVTVKWKPGEIRYLLTPLKCRPLQRKKQ